MWFRVAIDKLAVVLLPGFLRKPAIMAFTQALVWPVEQLYDTWRAYRAANCYKLQHTGQVGSLRQALNDALDPDARRIEVVGPDPYERKYLYTPAEEKPQYLGEFYVHPDTDYAYKGIDFIVYVPLDRVGSDPYRIKYIHTSTEKKPSYLGKLYLNTHVDYADIRIDVTDTLHSKELFQLKALLDFYKPASKRYKILAHESTKF